MIEIGYNLGKYELNDHTRTSNVVDYNTNGRISNVTWDQGSESFLYLSNYLAKDSNFS